MFEHHVVGQARACVRSTLPVELVGEWGHGSSVLEFRADGRQLVGGPPVPWTVSEDGMELTIAGTTFQRIFGSGLRVLGVWYCTAIGEEIHFRADGTYSSHWDEGDDYSGEYVVEGQWLAFSELRSYVRVSDTTWIWDWLLMPQSVCTYELCERELRFTCPTGNFVLTRI